MPFREIPHISMLYRVACTQNTNMQMYAFQKMMKMLNEAFNEFLENYCPSDIFMTIYT